MICVSVVGQSPKNLTLSMIWTHNLWDCTSIMEDWKCFAASFYKGFKPFPNYVLFRPAISTLIVYVYLCKPYFYHCLIIHSNVTIIITILIFWFFENTQKCTLRIVLLDEDLISRIDTDSKFPWCESYGSIIIFCTRISGFRYSMSEIRKVHDF